LAIQTKFKQIVKKLSSTDLYNRAKGIDQLRKSLHKDVYLDSLIYLLEAAGKSFPNSLEDWDDGSYHLVGFCSEYPHSELVKPIEKNFEHYSERAKLQALYLLITIKTDVARDAYIRIIEKYSKQFELGIDVAYIFEETEWAPSLVKKFIPLLKDNNLNASIFHMMLLCLRNSGEDLSLTSDEKNLIIDQIKRNYQNNRVAYLSYDKDYSLQFVYQAWKESYAMIRSEMGIYLQLMQYFFDDEIQSFLLEALQFNDPYLKVDAVISLLERGYNVSRETIEFCAYNIEACVWFYTRLSESSKEHFYKINEEIQHSFVKNRFFHYLVDHDDFGIVPDEIEVVKRHDTTNYYGQEVTYYLVKFKSQRDDWAEKGWMAGYVGAYLTEQIPSPKMLEDTITTFTSWDQLTEVEHIQQLEQFNKDDYAKHDSEVILESKPTWHYGTFVLGFITAVRTWTSFSNNDPIYFLLLAMLWGVFLFKVYATIKLRKESKVILKRRQLTFIKANESITIELHKIYRMTIELRKWGKNEGKMAGYQLKVKYIVFYDKDENEILAIPSTFINTSLLMAEIQMLTNHLVEQPIIDVYENDLSA